MPGTCRSTLSLPLTVWSGSANSRCRSEPTSPTSASIRLGNRAAFGPRQFLVHVANLECDRPIADAPIRVKRFQFRGDIMNQGVLLEPGRAALAHEASEVEQIGAKVLDVLGVRDIAVARHIASVRSIGD